jgi:hypothetical protein
MLEHIRSKFRKKIKLKNHEYEEIYIYYHVFHQQIHNFIISLNIIIPSFD